MGLDGGTIPTRGELVKMKEKPEQKDRYSDMIHKWSNCSLSQLPLELPIATCHLGMLYRKQSVLELLLGKTKLRERKEFIHIESMRDVVELQLKRNPRETESVMSFICPVTGLEMNGRQRFICLWNCRCVLSERALLKVKSTVCHNCGNPYSNDDIIVINPNDDDLKVMVENMKQRKMQRPVRKQIETTTTSISTNTSTNTSTSTDTSTSTVTTTSRDNTSTTSGTHSDGKAPAASVENSSQPTTVDRQTDRVSEQHSGSKKSLKRKKSHKSSDKKEHKSSKSKKHKKHKKVKADTDNKPKLHPGWSKYLSSM